ncbi:putative ABC transport system ATP-binding protein/lipoprotein-releasing system ATP-binding protein [Salana multivorans]|uniref:Putative ABC transport system ATP-binding protein/lipoprotein-releasing system ATP-binding protein n=1 Tax=Salana multivorans TaxID=120377 RepID=A0A3N2D0G7_9MICO|nr:ATP-binding cassette domain-containing protein [Salana multivorans]ROR93272.1 putative ABC transport system ATP-binding protein/lipoprotein-releasing system ATP-binding protein [Salana multivorans]
MRLSVRGLTYRYPGSDTDVLSGVELEIPSGTTVAIVGPSGSGKTTLLALLGGLLPVQDGRIVARSSDGSVHRVSEVATWALQTVSLLPDRTTLENVCLGAFLDGATRAQAREVAMERLRDMGVEGLAATPARFLSGGEAQRVGLARALASRRPVLLADEPTGQLDARTTDGVLDAMMGASRRTVVLVTHDLAAARRCDMRFRLRSGSLVAAEDASA